jgi:hypothetical protein
MVILLKKQRCFFVSKMKRSQAGVEKPRGLPTSANVQLQINSILFQSSLLDGKIFLADELCKSRWPVDNSMSYVHIKNNDVPVLTVWARMDIVHEHTASSRILEFLIKSNAHKDKRVNFKELLFSVRNNKWKFLSVVNTPELFDACECCKIWIQCLHIFQSTQNYLLLTKILDGNDVCCEFYNMSGQRSLPLIELITHSSERHEKNDLLSGNYERLIEQMVAHIECFEMDVFQPEGGWTSAEKCCSKKSSVSYNVEAYLKIARFRMEAYRKYRDITVAQCLIQ